MSTPHPNHSPNPDPTPNPDPSQITGPISEEFSHLTSLVNLNIAANQMTGHLPEAMFSGDGVGQVRPPSERRVYQTINTMRWNLVGHGGAGQMHSNRGE